jgi:Kelch motif protein
MSQVLQIETEIKGDLRVGANPNPANGLAWEIKNLGSAISLPAEGGIFSFFLAGPLGSSEKALFLNEADARSCTRKLPRGWSATWNFQPKDTFRLQISTFEKSVLNANATLKIEFLTVVSKTGPGSAVLDFGFGFGKEPKQVSRQIKINKIAPKTGIIAFYSDPPSGVSNLPGQDVTLKWRTNKLVDVKLVQKGVTYPLVSDFNEDEGSYVLKAVTTEATFTLSGQGQPSDSLELVVRILPHGWHEASNFILEGDPAYPKPANQEEREALDLLPRKEFALEATQLFNANNQSLYAVFRHTWQDQERASLYQTENPLARWNFVESSVPDQTGWIPAGFAGSPGVYFDDHLWLIGGSQIDPDNTSNVVWRFDPQKKIWQNMGVAGWSPRMGHAVLVFRNKIWVMGGRSSSGNALGDIWSYDSRALKWERVSAKAPWEPRCLFHPAVFGDRIWLYGGTKEPFSSKLFSDVWIYPPYAGDTWEDLKITGILQNVLGKGPVASCLEVFNGKLYLFGKFLSSATDGSGLVEPGAFSLSDPLTRKWEPLVSDDLRNWGGTNSFSYQLVNFQNKILVAKALAYDQPNLTLKLFVPSSRAIPERIDFGR